MPVCTIIPIYLTGDYKMALFRRNTTEDTTALPEEVNSYYQAENRERTWMAWLLALVTLAVTAIVIIGLFFGGRWVYRKVRHTPSSSTPSVTQKPAASTESNKPNSSPSPNTATTTPSTTPSPSTTSGTVNAPTNPTPTPTTTTPPPSTATSNSAAKTNLPNAGPGDTLAIFVVVTVLAYFAHRKFSVQKQ
jgi:cytoskeletal protein RodZ